jgi:hypothetical protein
MTGAAMLALLGCGGAAEDHVRRAIDLAAPVDPAGYAGDVAFRIAETLPAGDRDIPFALYLGLAPATDTRLGANAFLDLRDLQLALPDLLTGPLEPACGLGLDLRFGGAEAVGDAVRARASVDARLYRCRQRGTEDEQRGARLFTQAIDVEAKLAAGLAGECLEFRLVDLDLAPRGLLGGLASLLGVTERARAAIAEKARAVLAENPVCPDLPPALDLLEPKFSAAGLREIGTGGIGAALSGSVDISAERLVALIALIESRARKSGGPAGPVAAPGQAAFRVDDTIDLRGTDIAVGLDVRLAARAPDRIGIETLLDLRDLQARLPDLAAGAVLVDTCGGRISMRSLEAEAREADLIASGRLALDNFDCERKGPATWQRGALLSTEEFGVRAELSAELIEGCVVFRLLDLTRDPPGAFAQFETGSGRVAAARALLLEAIRLILEEAPLCPDLPPELAVLDPRFYSGVPREIGKGGTGLALDGSVDVSPGTVVDLLRLLQDRGTLPPPP